MMRLRSLLFAPAVRPDLLIKLPRAGADAVIIDCEDATPADLKTEGRDNARRVGGELVADGNSVFVRVNAVGTEWFDEDVKEAVPEGAAGIVVPMVETPQQLDMVSYALHRTGYNGLTVIIGLETARGVASARELLAHDVASAGYFGAEDFIADMGGVRTESNIEVLYARSEVALAGRLARVPVVDQVVVAFGDLNRFAQEAQEARALGYSGKMCIHPGQVAPANEAFTPTSSEVAAARHLIEVYEAAEREGSAVVVVDGRMIDGPLVAQARKVLASAD
jgi:citrate lyase subunit beta / citryl-CoA lyase